MTHPFATLIESGPLLADPQQKALLTACISAAGQIARVDELMADQGDGFWYPKDDWRSAYRPYTVRDGILLLPVKGLLLHNFAWQLGSYATGYDYIWRAFERGLDDPEVRGIALIIHSPGGLVAGNQVLVDKMAARRDEKPIRAFAQETACSAAYNIAAVAPHIAISPTGTVGSIGVYTAHIDWSAYNERLGLKYTFIFAGEGKVDGNPEEPLSEEARQRMQARVDELYSVFVASVSRNRGLDEETIRNDLKAHSYSASEAVSNGLADSVGSQEDALSAFAGSLDGASDDEEGDEEMSTQDDQAAVAQAAHEEAVATARTEAATTAATAMQKRIGAILQHEEAKGRGELANHLAFETDMSEEAAVALLAKAPKEAATAEGAQTGGDALAAAMSGVQQPELGTGEGNGASQEDPNSADGILQLAASVGLKGFTKPAAK